VSYIFCAVYRPGSTAFFDDLADPLFVVGDLERTAAQLADHVVLFTTPAVSAAATRRCRPPTSTLANTHTSATNGLHDNRRQTMVSTRCYGLSRQFAVVVSVQPDAWNNNDIESLYDSDKIASTDRNLPSPSF